jgi:hypothetical protein
MHLRGLDHFLYTSRQQHVISVDNLTVPTFWADLPQRKVVVFDNGQQLTCVDQPNPGVILSMP